MQIVTIFTSRGKNARFCIRINNDIQLKFKLIIPKS